MPIVAAAVIAGGASVYAASKQTNAAKNAARQSDRATDATLQLQRDMYNQTRADQEPWRLAGAAALNRLQDPTANFQASPDYQFRLDAGLRGVNQNRATAGLLQSGSALRGINDYAQNTASNEFGNWWQRQSGLAGLGQSANQSNQQAGQNYANSGQQAYQNNANNQMQSSYYQGNAAAQGAGQVAGALGWGLTNFPWGGKSLGQGVNSGGMNTRFG